MTTQPEEVFGEVIGYVATVNPDLPQEQKIKFTTQAEFEDLCQRSNREEFCGILFSTEIETSHGVEISEGVNPHSLGKRMWKLVCGCGQCEWFENSGFKSKFVCEKCSEPHCTIEDFDQYDTEY